MADASYDVVIVGGGNKSMVAAMYLAKYGGLSVGVFEDRHELCGGWCTEESPAPGFLADHCSSWHTRAYYTLVWEDFPEWIEYGAKPIDNLLTSSCIFLEDDTWCGVYNAHLDPTQEKTAALFAKFSEKDAEKWLWFWDKTQKYIDAANMEWEWNPARPFGELDGLDKLFRNPDSGVKPEWQYMTYTQVLEDLFESTEVQMAFARAFHAIGVPDDAYGGGVAIINLFHQAQSGISFAGGVHALAHATQRVFQENGGKTFTQHKVEKILIENGKATGVRLEDGTEVKAKKAVLSGVDPYQLCVELIGEEHLSHDIVRKIKRLEMDWVTIGWYTYALNERPRYKAESFNPDIIYSCNIHLGNKTIDSLHAETARRRFGLWPERGKLNLIIIDHSVIPGTNYAPPGKDSCLVEQWVLPAWKYTEQEWKELEKQLADDIIDMWQKYAPNVTWENVIGYVPVTPFFTSRQARNWGRSGNWAVIDNTPNQVGRWRPIPELSSGRMPIKNLYATGAGWHPLAGAYTWQGYNAYKVLAEDLGLRKPWEEKGRPW